MAKFEDDPTWLNVNYPQRGGPPAGWREELVAQRERVEQQALMRDLAADVVPRLRRKKAQLSQETIGALRTIRRVALQSTASSCAGSAAGTPCAAEEEEAPPSSWRNYGTERGATARVEARVRELGRTVHVEAKGENKIFYLKGKTGKSEYGGRFHGEQLEPSLLPRASTGGRDSLDTWNTSHGSQNSGGRGERRSRSALGLYENYEREPPTPPPPFERDANEPASRCSMYDASYVDWHPNQRGAIDRGAYGPRAGPKSYVTWVPNSAGSLEAQAKTHPDVHLNFNHGRRSRPSNEGFGQYARYKS